MKSSRLASFALLCALALGCGGSAGSGPTGPGADADVTSPVGSFSLGTVNGTQVPMLWDEMDVSIGMLRSYWTGGKVVFRPDSTFTVTFRHKITGPGLPGNEQADSWSGNWRLLGGGQIEMKKTGGGVKIWLTTDQIYTLTVNSSAPGLNGQDEPIVFVFVRD